ncbi:hypothetical protein [Robinsoniella sp. KNHs210]|uniref:hypothetical protein n=1 Tax=Robinsoniella sp. KNHs210 TaxID=1469950 RepID=UPI00047FFC4D|nr:hypothetical protein [Robinsoniella sp. KNHs210]
MKKELQEKQNQENEMNLNEILDKMILLKEGPSFLKKTIYIALSICVIMFVGLMCICIYRNNFTIESILATMLAFFSIFISIFFYFKADETSNRFYDSSYKFMKDISVTLGKIEERFGEKLNSLNDKVSHLDNISSEKSEEIQEQKDDKDKIINELMDKANLDEEEKKKYRRQLEENEQQIEILKREQFRARKEAAQLRQIMDSVGLEDRWEPNERILISLLNGEETERFTKATQSRLRKLGYIDKDGYIDKEKIVNALHMR